jgi:LysM domain
MRAMRHPTRPAATLLTGLLVAGCIPASPLDPSPSGSAIEASATATAAPSPSGPSTRPSFVRPTPTPLPTFLVYTVRPGDTLSSIARTFRTTALSIAFWNRAAHPSLDPDSPSYAPDRIQAGWDLFLVPDVELDPEDLPPEPSPSVAPPPPVPSSPAASAS